MTKNFKDLIALLSYAVSGKEVPDSESICFRKIYSLAKAQQVQTIIYPAIKQLRAEGKITIEDGLFRRFESEFFRGVAFSVKRNQYMSRLIQKLDQHGIRSCILKGITLSELYPIPDSRISSDVDLLLPDPKDLDAAIAFLAKDGFMIGKIIKGSHQIECSHPQYGLIEVHTDICDETARDVWFESQITPSCEYIKTADKFGGFYYTLPETDSAIFVAFHFLKHFLSHGCGIRQLLDMLLYLKMHRDGIDWDRFNSLFFNLNYLQFIEQCKDIGNKYFDMDFVVPSSNDELCLSILSDMETGGIFGNNEAYRMTFTYHYTKLRSSTLSHNHSRAKHFFKRMLLFARARRYNIFLIIKDYFSKKKAEASYLPDINKRLTLFKNLGFFEQ